MNEDSVPAAVCSDPIAISDIPIATLAEPAAVENGFWPEKYAAWTMDNMEEHGVLNVFKATYAFVRDDHPVIEYLSFNRDLIGRDIHTLPKIDGQWFKLSNELVRYCCTKIKQRWANRMCLCSCHVRQSDLSECCAVTSSPDAVTLSPDAVPEK